MFTFDCIFIGFASAVETLNLLPQDILAELVSLSGNTFLQTTTTSFNANNSHCPTLD